MVLSAYRVPERLNDESGIIQQFQLRVRSEEGRYGAIGSEVYVPRIRSEGYRFTDSHAIDVWSRSFRTVYDLELRVGAAEVRPVLDGMLRCIWSIMR
jgi:hypothetical protein